MGGCSSKADMKVKDPHPERSKNPRESMTASSGASEHDKDQAAMEIQNAAAAYRTRKLEAQKSKAAAEIQQSASKYLQKKKSSASLNTAAAPASEGFFSQMSNRLFGSGESVKTQEVKA